ncbi:MAG: DMT family transporter [Pseudomonadota bacterium]
MVKNPAQKTNDLVPYLVMLGTALCFSTNIIFGRFVAPEAHPFVLAFIRWLLVALILSPLVFWRARGVLEFVRGNLFLLIVLSVLGMGVSGGGVYWGLQMTTATNATLIYSVAPVAIVVLERIFKGRSISGREVIGAFVAFGGVATIVSQGTFTTFAQFQFNNGDILIAAATLSWACYSILLKSDRLKSVGAITLFCLIAFFGALVNLPFAFSSLAVGSGMPQSTAGWQALAGIVVISSLMAFSAYQFGVRHLGPSLAGMFMFLMTPFGVLLAVFFLNETLEAYQMLAIVAVMVGVATATMPKRKLASTAENSSAERA